MNTGIQRSSATPYGAWTTTTPVKHFKTRPKKDIDAIMAAHRIPYQATASVAFLEDLYKKVKKAMGIKGTRFFHIYAPCPAGWKSRPEDTIKLARLAVQTTLFPIFEVENGEKYTLNIQVKEPKPMKDYIRLQGRFRHLKDEQIQEIQENVNRRWDSIRKLCGVA
jgi:pyruvate/2-oxoacid:ferredoxin oxidoreductase beta subunit